MLDSLSPAMVNTCSKTQVMDTLWHLMPWVKAYWHRPLSDFAGAVFRADGFSAQSRSRHHAMQLFRACIERVAIRSGYSAVEALQASRQIVEAPIIQTGPHCHLLVAPDAFYTHLFCIMGLNAHGRRWHIYHSDITVKFVEKAKRGPAWLHLDGKPVNVFGLSRSNMMPFSICGQNGPYSFALTNADEAKAVNNAAERLKALLPNAAFASAAEAIKAANLSMWKRWIGQSVSLLQFDDFDIADLMAAHLRDGDEWMARQFVGDGQLATAILQEIDALGGGQWAGWLRSTTHFFWGLRDGRIFPVFLKDGHLQHEAAQFKVAFRPESLANALEARELVPNMFTSFLVTSILPGIRVLGGSRQTIYYPLMRYVLAKALGRQTRGVDPLLGDMGNDVRPGVWGHRVLAPAHADPFAEIEASGEDPGLADLTRHYSALTLHEGSGLLASFTEDPSWAHLASAVARGVAGRHSAEWGHSA